MRLGFVYDYINQTKISLHEKKLKKKQKVKSQQRLKDGEEQRITHLSKNT